MGYKLLELEEVKESGRWTESGVEAPKAYKGHKHCAYCEKEFIVNQLKRGREPLYCSTNCRVKAYKKRKGVYDETHPLAMKEQGVKGINDSQLNELKGQIDELKEAQKTQVEELREAQKVVNNTILNKIAALKKEITKTQKETSLQPQKTNNITTKGVAIDVATSATGALIAEKVNDFLTKWENKPTTRGELELFKKQVNHWLKQVQGNIRIDINALSNKIKEQEKKGVFH